MFQSTASMLDIFGLCKDIKFLFIFWIEMFTDNLRTASKIIVLLRR